jgi:uncharacterized membrane-anchored protein
MLPKFRENCLYWFGIILMHPVGATMGDYLAKPEGFGLGNINSNLLLLVVLAIIITSKLAFKNKIIEG